jgi:putative DNA primase/helicase
MVMDVNYEIKKNEELESGTNSSQIEEQDRYEPVQSIAEEKLNDIQVEQTVQIAILDHRRVLTALLNELRPIDFHEKAELESNKAVSRKEYLIITNEEILETAKQRKWSLCMNDGFLYSYNGAFWKQLSKSDLIKFLGDGALKLGVEVFEAKYHKFRDELYKQFMSTAYLPRPEKVGTEVLINLKNGTFVLSPEKQCLQPFDKSDFLTYQLQFDYNPDATAPIFQKYLDRVLPDIDQQMILAEYVGYVFIKQNTLKLEKALVLFGGGANGKSVFFEIINALLGVENVSNYTLHSLTNETGYQRAKLSDKLLNYASEISPNMDSTFFKQLVSGEPVEARLPYKEPFLLTDYAKFIFNTNILPRDVEQNEAFFRRFLLIHFAVTIPEDERDPSLSGKIIATELAGVFNWALQGLQRLLQNHKFTYSSAVDAAVREYKINSDSVHLYLNDFGYVPHSVEEVSLKYIYEGYKQYCGDFGYKCCSLKSLSERLKNLNFTVTRKSKGNVVYAKKIRFHDHTSDTASTSIPISNIEM